MKRKTILLGDTTPDHCRIFANRHSVSVDFVLAGIPPSEGYPIVRALSKYDSHTPRSPLPCAH